MNILSWNCQGLTSLGRRRRLNTILYKLPRTVDILCIQEHKLQDGNTDLLHCDVWTQGKIIASEATDGVHGARNCQVLGGKGGVALAFSPKWSPHISTEGILGSNRGVWVILDHPRLGRLGIMGIYAPNNSQERTILWQEMYCEMDNSIKWMILGNFNMVEVCSDQQGGHSKLLAGEEKVAWHCLKRKFNLIDSFVYQEDHLCFSWDSLHQNCHNVQQQLRVRSTRYLQRLDRVYTYNQDNAKEFTITSTILVGIVFSDHAPIALHL
jgi:exonuclease III